MGDFGVPGIQDFIDTHECSIPCKKLALANKDILNDTLESLVNDIDTAKQNGEEAHVEKSLVLIQAPPGTPSIPKVGEKSEERKKEVEDTFTTPSTSIPKVKVGEESEERKTTEVEDPLNDEDKEIVPPASIFPSNLPPPSNPQLFTQQDLDALLATAQLAAQGIFAAKQH